MTELAYTDFRSFIEEAKKISDYRIIEGADWDAEIGALVESTAELVPQPPMLIFDKVKGYPAGYRVCSLPYAAYRRVALRSEEHTSELQSHVNLVCRLLLEKKNKKTQRRYITKAM